MSTRILLWLLLLAASCATAFSTSEDIVQRHLSVRPGANLVVDVDFGTVDISAGADDQIVVDAHRLIDIPDLALEKEFAAAAPITVSQEGNTTTIRSRSNRQWQWKTSHARMDAHYGIRLPRNFNVNLRTGGGTIQVADLTGELKAETGGGALTFKTVRGPIDGHTSGGEVKLADCQGAIKIETSGGHIDSLGGNGSLDARTSGGSVSVRNFGGQVQLVSSGGRMDLHDIGGPLTARTSGGAIDATVTAVTDVRLQTNAGAINVAIPPSGGFNVDAKTSIGRVSTNLPINAEHRHDGSLVGALNGGGKSLYLRTSAGSISINPAASKTAAVSSQ